MTDKGSSGCVGYGARGPVAECRLRRLDDGRYEYSPTKGAAFTVTAAALVRRLVALLPPARRHSTRTQAEARLIELGVALPSRVFPPATAPPQLNLAV